MEPILKILFGQEKEIYGDREGKKPEMGVVKKHMWGVCQVIKMDGSGWKKKKKRKSRNIKSFFRKDDEKIETLDFACDDRVYFLTCGSRSTPALCR